MAPCKLNVVPISVPPLTVISGFALTIFRFCNVTVPLVIVRGEKVFAASRVFEFPRMVMVELLEIAVTDCPRVNPLMKFNE